MNLNDLETFIVVAEEGTFTAAAQRLRVPISTVSRRVARLESDLGVALLRRGARSIALSEDGRALSDRCGPALREVGTAASDVSDQRDAPRGKLRITAPFDIGCSTFVAEIFAAYTRAYPEVQLEFIATNRFVDLLEESFDVAFRSHTRALPSRDDIITRTLVELPLSLYASAGYAAEKGAFASWDDLADHRVVGHGTVYRAAWLVEPTVITDSYGASAALVAAGAGLGALPDLIAAPYVARGELTRLDIPYDVAPARLSLVWLRSRHLAPRVRAFIDLAVEHAGV